MTFHANDIHAKPRGGFIGRLHAAIHWRVKRRLSEDEGIAAIEMAFIFPFLIILMLGAVELFLGSMASRRLTRLTNTIGDLITQQKGTLTRSAINDYYAAARYIMGQFKTANRLAVSVFTFTLDRSGNPTLSWRHDLGDFTCRAQVPQLTPEQRASMADGNDLVIAYGCYKYGVTFGRLALSGTPTINMSDEVTLRPRQQLEVKCSDCTS